MRELRRILIIKPSSLGDVATAMPMVVDLHEAFPQAKIDWVVHPGLMDLLRGHQAIRELIPFDRKKLTGWWYSRAARRELLGLLRRLRAGKYDCVIDAQGLFRSGFLAWATGAKVRVGFANAREGATLFYTHKVKLPREPQVGVVRMRALLEPLGVKAAGAGRAKVALQGWAVESVRGMIGEGRPVVVMPGARWETKRWAVERYMEIVRRLQGRGEQVVLAGSPQEKGLCDQIERACVGAVNVAGRTKMGEMVALLARAKLVVGNDSGPLHVAVALERPVVGVYGPTDPRYVGPYGQLERVVRFETKCQPCRRKMCAGHECMEGLTLEAVWERIVGILENAER